MSAAPNSGYYEDVHMSDAGEGNFGSDEDRKLFLGGLSWDTEEQDLLDYFSKYGPVVNVNIKYDSATGKPRGFGFITFASVAPIEAVLNGGPHMIRNRAVDPKRPRSRPAFKKIFVGGIDADMAEDEIVEYFTRFGPVEGIECPFDHQKGRRREFCFVIFNTEEAAEAAITEPKQIIGNKQCDIKKAQPQRNGGAQGGDGGMRGGGRGRFGQGGGMGRSQGGGGGFGGFGASSNGYSNGFQQQRSPAAWNNGQGFVPADGGQYGGPRSNFRKTTFTNSNFPYQY